MPDSTLVSVNPQLPARVKSRLKPEIVAMIEKNGQYFDLGQLSTVQLICKGKSRCPYGNECPLENPEPHQRCQLEMYYQEKWLDEYMKNFGIQYTERSLVSILVSLVVVDIQLMRQQAQIQQEGFEQHVIIEEEKGEKRIDKKLHNLTSLIESLERRKMSILKHIKEEIGNTQTQKVIGSIIDVLSAKKQ